MNSLRALAAEVGRGDRAAKEQLQQQLAPHLARIVRRAMLHVSGTSPLTQRVRAAARRVARTEAPQAQEELIGQVGEDLCESLLSRLQVGLGRGQGLLATVPN
jgi:hypothetical protein